MKFDDIIDELNKGHFSKEIAKKKIKKFTGLDISFRNFIKHGIASTENHRKTFRIVNELYHQLGYKISTLDVIFTNDVRSNFVGTEYYDLSKELVRLSDSEKDKLILEQKKSLEKKHRNKIRFSKERVIRIIRDFHYSKNISENLISVMLACGARPVEITIRSEFEYVNDLLIRQTELAKKDHSVSVEKPLIELSFDELISSVQKIKEAFADKTVGRNLESNALSEANEIIKKLFKSDEITLYSCRGIYAVLSHHLFAETGICGQDPTLAIWAATFLGHDSMNSQLNYTKFDIVREKTDRLSNARNDTKELQFKVLKAEFENCPCSQTEMEKRMILIIPRRVIREFYNKN